MLLDEWFSGFTDEDLQKVYDECWRYKDEQNSTSVRECDRVLLEQSGTIK